VQRRPDPGSAWGLGRRRGCRPEQSRCLHPDVRQGPARLLTGGPVPAQRDPPCPDRRGGRAGTAGRRLPPGGGPYPRDQHRSDAAADHPRRERPRTVGGHPRRRAQRHHGHRPEHRGSRRGEVRSFRHGIRGLTPGHPGQDGDAAARAVAAPPRRGAFLTPSEDGPVSHQRHTARDRRMRIYELATTRQRMSTYGATYDSPFFSCWTARISTTLSTPDSFKSTTVCPSRATTVRPLDKCASRAASPTPGSRTTPTALTESL